MAEFNENYKVKKEDFEFVQIDKKIHDCEFETKPTTFAKDALKRFCKNKSSVVGAIIIGILLLCSFLVPVISANDIKNVHVDQALLSPKLFNAGTGFWDGTKKYYNIAYDGSKEAPVGFKKDAVLSMHIDDVSYVNQAHETASGGYFLLLNEKTITSNDDALNNLAFFYNYTNFSVNDADNYKVSIDMGNENNVFGNTLGEYRVSLQYRVSGSNKLITLKDWSQDYSSYTLDISSALKENELSELKDAKVRFDLKPTLNQKSYILLKSVMISCDNEEANETLSEISFDDANACALITKQNNGTFPIGYWQSNTAKDIYKAEMRIVSFVYDEYEAIYGNRTMTIGESILNQYIKNGWCQFDYNVGAESFKVLNSEKCPIIEVYSVSIDPEYNVYSVEAKVSYYRYLGLNKYPIFLLGTTNDGKDIVTLAFNSLKTSLLIAILSSAVCMFIGIVWGSISGYFGGTVDLVMERFCEILSGVPWIVVMTLAILLFGNTIFTFALALCMTGWIGTAGRTRTQFYRFKGREYVLASRTLGAKDSRLIFKHILPNALGTIVTSCVLMIPSVIFSEATLAYLNLGLQGVDSFGVLLSDNQQYLSSHPALIVFPAIIISLLMISFNLFGNGLRDALNPSLKGSD